MNIESFQSHEELSRWTATQLTEAVAEKPDLLLCCATGSTPTLSYQYLIEEARARPGHFDQMRMIQLDEWLGIPDGNEASCRSYLRMYLVGPLGMSQDNYISFEGDHSDPQSLCDSVSEKLDQAGPIDICLLGLGLNGHLGFNEPAEILTPRAHVAELNEVTQQHAMVLDIEPKPTQGVTLGIQDILESKLVLLLVSGAHKKAAFDQLMKGKVSSHFPGSVLWDHPNVICAVCDA